MDLWLELDKVMSYGIHRLSFKHAKEVRYHADYRLAEQLAKIMSGKKSLSPDLVRGNIQGHDFIKNQIKLVEPSLLENEVPNMDSICVSSSSHGNPGPTEYYGVQTATGKVLFHMKYTEATNNIGDFLGIVHALALLKQNKVESRIVYSDNLVPISWVRQKTCKTKYIRTEHNSRVFEHIDRAVKWLNSNQFDTAILKWNTFTWGQMLTSYKNNY